MSDTTGNIESIAIKRVFRLGEFKSLHVDVVPNELSDDQREQIILENLFDAYKTLFLHQKITAELYDGDVEMWDRMLNRLNDVKHTYLNKEN